MLDTPFRRAPTVEVPAVSDADLMGVHYEAAPERPEDTGGVPVEIDPADEKTKPLDDETAEQCRDTLLPVAVCTCRNCRARRGEG